MTRNAAPFDRDNGIGQPERWNGMEPDILPHWL